MSNLVVVGIQWGDEGKGKIVDLLTPGSDAVVRFQGGANAGHTLVIGDKKYVLHLIPSGILHKNVSCVVGNGVVFDPEACLEEIEMLKTNGLLTDDSQLMISENAHVVFSYHREIDRLREEKRAKGSKIGTTGRGIGPAYEDKVCRLGIRCGELINPDVLSKRLDQIIDDKNEYITKLLNGEAINKDETISHYIKLGEKLKPYVKNTQKFLIETTKAGKNILFEGAQGTALDIDHGTYPFVTSSNTTAAGASTGSGLGPRFLTNVLGVTKAYCTRVGNGPFMTELFDDTAKYLQEKGGEFGATTGRPRRCGWIDLVYLKHSVALNSVNLLTITKLDVLSGLDKIKLCTGYELKGKKIDYVPSTIADLEELKPIYHEMPGWKTELKGETDIAKLPGEVKDYIDFIEGFLEVPVAIISTGPARESTIVNGNLFSQTDAI